MTRDDLIAGTRQLIDEGDRLRANPSLASLQMWLQRSDDLLATAWGSMDRYHLAWLMVGKPKGIVRGRPMTADEEAAYVREVAEQKTAALRMSLDAVERQAMPFVGESGGVGPGTSGIERRRPRPRRRLTPGRPVPPIEPRIEPGCRPTRGCRIAWPKRAARRTPISTMTPAGTASRQDAAVTERVTAVGGTRTVPAPDAIARDYILLGLRLDQHIPGLVDGYFGPADLKAQVDMEQLRPPARFARRRAGAARPAAGRGRRSRPARLARRPARRARGPGGRPRRRGGAVPRPRHALLRPPPARRPDVVFEEAAARIDTLLPGDAPLSDRLADWDRRFEIPLDRLPSVVDWLVDRFRARAAATFGLPSGEAVRVGFVSEQPWGGYTWYDGGRRSRVEINIDLPSRATTSCTSSPTRPTPGHHLEHAWKEADLVDARRSARGVDPAHQHARMPRQRGPRRTWATASRSGRAATVELLVELVRPGWSGGWRPIRAPARSGREPGRASPTSAGRSARSA